MLGWEWCVHRIYIDDRKKGFGTAREASGLSRSVKLAASAFRKQAFTIRDCLQGSLSCVYIRAVQRAWPCGMRFNYRASVAGTRAGDASVRVAARRLTHRVAAVQAGPEEASYYQVKSIVKSRGRPLGRFSGLRRGRTMFLHSCFFQVSSGLILKKKFTSLTNPALYAAFKKLPIMKTVLLKICFLISVSSEKLDQARSDGGGA
jgi:hypothetical protein